MLGLLLAILLLLVLVAGARAWYAVSTESGTRFLLARVGPLPAGTS